MAAISWAPLTHAGVTYQYDDLGRVVQATNSDGSFVVYRYDANGNILRIERHAGTALAIASFSPSTGHVNTVVTIIGNGFSTTPAENAVTIGGVTATVTASTATSLTTTVPAGAVTGSIIVTTGGSSATSTQPMTVLYPSISSFTPSLVNTGALVTVYGSSLNLVPGSASASVNGVGAALNSISNTQAVIVAPANAGSGPVRISTSYGVATSTGSLLVTPAAVNAANVTSVATATPGGAAQSVTLGSSSNSAIVVFNGTAGQRVSLMLTSVTMGGGTLTVYKPDGTFLSNIAISNNAILDLAPLPAAGTYQVVLSGSTGGAVVKVIADAIGLLATDGTALPVSLVAGQNAAFTFTAFAGQGFSLALPGYTTSPGGGSMVAVILKPDGSILSNCATFYDSQGYCDFGAPTAGTYTLRLDPAGTAAASFNVVLSQDVVTPLTMNAPAVTYNTAVPGQNGRFTINATAGQRATFVWQNSSIYYGTIYIVKPDGGVLANTGLLFDTTGWFLDLTFPTTGTYTAMVYLDRTQTGHMDVRFVTDVSGTVNPNGTPTSLTLDPGKNAELTFTGTAGHGYSLVLTPFSATPGGGQVNASILRADGSILVNCGSHTSNWSNCDFSTPTTGTYTVRLDPAGVVASSFGVVLSDSQTATLVPNAAPVTFTTAAPGQNMYYSVSGTAGQRATFVYQNNTIYWGTIYILKPDGSVLTNTGQLYGAPGGAIDLTFPTTGTYTIIVFVDWASTGSMNTRLVTEASGTVTSNGTPTSLTLDAGQNAQLTFTGTAGHGYSLVLTPFSTTPGGGTVYANILRADGSTLVNCGNHTSSWSNCDFSIPTTGTYTVRLDPGGVAASSFGVVLSDSQTSTLAANAAPVTFTTAAPGQNMYYSVSGTAGQQATFVYQNNTIYWGTIYVLKPDGSVLTNTGQLYGAPSGNIQMTFPTTGTYTIIVYVDWASTGHMDTQLVSAIADLTGTIATNGSQSPISLASGQNAAFTFTSAANVGYSLVLAGLSTTPSGGSVSAVILRPDGSTLANCNNYQADSGNCDFFITTAGTYTLKLDPAGTVTSTFTPVLSEDLVGTLTMNATAVTYNTTVPGQNGRYTLSGTAGQRATFVFQNNSIYYGTIYILKPDGSALANSAVFNGVTSGYLDLTLPTTGTYTAMVYVDKTSTGHMDVRFIAEKTGTVNTNGTAAAVTLAASQNAAYTFTGTAGATYGLAITSLTSTPSGASIGISFLKPDGTSFSSAWNCVAFTASSGNCDISALPVSGTYTVRLDPSGVSSTSFNLYLPQATSGGALTVNGSTKTYSNTVPGRNAMYTFSGTSGQLLSLVWSSNTIPAGSLFVFSPSGSTVASTAYNGTTSGTLVIPALPATGTYTVMLFVDGTSTGNQTVKVKTR